MLIQKNNFFIGVWLKKIITISFTYCNELSRKPLTSDLRIFPLNRIKLIGKNSKIFVIPHKHITKSKSDKSKFKNTLEIPFKLC